MTAVRPPARFGGLVFDGDLVAEFTEKPQIGEGWINGGFFVFEPARPRLPRGRRHEPGGRALERLRRTRASSSAYRHDGFWQCMDTLRDKRLLDRCGSPATGAVEAPGRDARRSGATGPTLVDGRHRPASAAGSCGGSLEAGARRRLPRARLGAQVEAVRSGLLERRDGRARRRPRPRRCSSARSGEYEIDTVIPPRGADDRRDRQPQPGLDVRDEHRAAPGRCSRPAGAAQRSSRSSSPRPTRPTATTRQLPYGEDTPLAGRHPYDVSKSCADLIAQSYAVTYDLPVVDHALRQLLRRRRPELEPDRARARSARCSAASGRSSAPTASSSATTSTSRTAPRPTCSWPRAGRATRLAGEAFNFSNETQVTVSELVERILRPDGIRPRARRPERGDERDPRST